MDRKSLMYANSNHNNISKQAKTKVPSLIEKENINVNVDENENGHKNVYENGRKNVYENGHGKYPSRLIEQMMEDSSNSDDDDEQLHNYSDEDSIE